jgi:hypothetical protein
MSGYQTMTKEFAVTPCGPIIDLLNERNFIKQPPRGKQQAERGSGRGLN